MPAPRTYRDDHAAWRRVQPLLPEPMRTLGHEPTETRWRWRDASVHLDRYDVDDSPLTVVVLHGAGGHGRLLSSAGRMLADAGCSTVMPDLPGYGLTDAPATMRRYEAWVALVGDLVRAEHERSGRPVGLFGMSLGGMLAWDVAASLPPGSVAAVVATNLLDPSDPAVRAGVARFAALGPRIPALLGATPRALDDLRLPLAAVADARGIANDPQVARALLADRRGTGNRIAIGFLRSWFAYRPAIPPQRWQHGPVLLAHPGDDRWTPTALSLPFFRRIAGPTRFVELENCGHLPMESPGTERLRDELRRFLGPLL
ncbi:MAG: alpha/beta fold hydrolase [Patulibacter sp.]|nr:alpha/beta fold hydrolase [Patulibacter sp.]